MNRTVGFAFPGARIQARYGRLVSTPMWERLERLDTLAGFLQAARDTALRPWIAQLDPAADAHQIEAQLRALFRRRVGELADWAPRPWRPALAWTGVLPDLPAIAARRRGEDTLWLRADERFGAVGAASARLPAGLRPLEGALAARQPLAGAWLAHWRALWPATRRSERRALEELVALLQGAARDAVHDAPAALAALQRPLRRLFRRNTRAPAGLFAYLALAWIEFGRLRGALLRRRLSLTLEGAAA